MKDEYIYPAIVYFDNDGISIEFPDLPGCLSCAENENEILKCAKEALGVHLYGIEQDNDVIPEPSSIKDIKPDENGVIMLVDVFMPTVRDRIRNHFIRKTLSIPYWLNIAAEQQGVNFSGVLQNALKEYLHIAE